MIDSTTFYAVCAGFVGGAGFVYVTARIALWRQTRQLDAEDCRKLSRLYAQKAIEREYPS